jgi:hypothetical protein
VQIFGSISKKMKRGARYCHALRDNSKANGYRWGDPVLDRPGVVRFDGPRRVVTKPNKQVIDEFCFSAVKPGAVQVMFKEYKSTVPGKTAYLKITVN